MENNAGLERVLAYKNARIIPNETLKEISGGAGGTNYYTTKLTADNRGNYDCGVDGELDL